MLGQVDLVLGFEGLQQLGALLVHDLVVDGQEPQAPVSQLGRVVQLEP